MPLETRRFITDQHRTHCLMPTEAQVRQLLTEGKIERMSAEWHRSQSWRPRAGVLQTCYMVTGSSANRAQFRSRSGIYARMHRY